MAVSLPDSRCFFARALRLRRALLSFGYSACGLTLRAVGKADVHFALRRCRQRKASKGKATPGAGGHSKRFSFFFSGEKFSGFQLVH
jgi:hypothetical protein